MAPLGLNLTGAMTEWLRGRTSNPDGPEVVVPQTSNACGEVQPAPHLLRAITEFAKSQSASAAAAVAMEKETSRRRQQAAAAAASVVPLLLSGCGDF
ncbi:hypothetical protein ACOMHN_040423 [Nucella lapillus]